MGPGGPGPRARRRLDQLCEDQIRVLATLDANRRVFATGSAGTGKTRLALTWARRARRREERTLLTCYNEPLAAEIRRQLTESEDLRIGAFLSTALALDGMPHLEIPDNADFDWWNSTVVGHLHLHWPEVTEHFDTIIIDEAQDFSPAWIAQLTALLDPDGPRRVLMVGDDAQRLYQRGFVPPEPEDGWTRCELVNNCRNTYEIGRLLRRILDGAPSPMANPEAIGVRWFEADTDDEAVVAVRDELLQLRVAERSPSSILVETVSSTTRERLRTELDLVPWEDRADGGIVCENVHRAKGLEADTVVLVAIDPDVTDALLYVGISRAVSELVSSAPALWPTVWGCWFP